METLKVEAERRNKESSNLPGTRRDLLSFVGGRGAACQIMAQLDESERIIEEAKQTVIKQDQLSDSRIRANNLK